jgi:hypothetical protein
VFPALVELQLRPGEIGKYQYTNSGVLERVPNFRLEVIRWAPVADLLVVEREGSATIADKTITWRGVDPVSLRDGKNL